MLCSSRFVNLLNINNKVIVCILEWKVRQEAVVKPLPFSLPTCKFCWLVSVSFSAAHMDAFKKFSIVILFLLFYPPFKNRDCTLTTLYHFHTQKFNKSTSFSSPLTFSLTF